MKKPTPKMVAKAKGAKMKPMAKPMAKVPKVLFTAGKKVAAKKRK